MVNYIIKIECTHKNNLAFNDNIIKTGKKSSDGYFWLFNSDTDKIEKTFNRIFFTYRHQISKIIIGI